MRMVRIDIEVPEYVAVALAHELDASCDVAYWAAYGIPGEQVPDIGLGHAARLAKLRKAASAVRSAILHG